MTSRAFFVPEQREIDLSALSDADYSLITRLHGEIGRGERVLLCLGTKGDRELTVYRHSSGAYYARHFAGGAHGDHKISRMTPEHLRGTDTWLTAWARAGIPAASEVTTDNHVRIDAVTLGEHVIALETQVQDDLPKVIKARDTQRRNARALTGQHSRDLTEPMLPVWFSPAGRPKWLYAVPTVQCQNRSWDATPDPRVVPAVGIRSVDVKPCESRWFTRCPDMDRGYCGRAHLWLELRGGLSISDIAEMLPAGELMPISVPAGVYLTDRLGFKRAESFGYVRPEPVQRTSASRRDDCASPAHLRPPPAPAALPVVPADAYKPCASHGQPWCPVCHHLGATPGEAG